MTKRATLVLNHNDVVQIVSAVGIDRFMSVLIEKLEAAFAEYSLGVYDVPVRSGFHYHKPVTGLVEWMPLHHKQQAVFLKAVGYHPTNPIREDLPTVVATFKQFDPITGRLIALADGCLLTAMRTGAASAVATRHLAPRHRIELGLVGCGAQAVTQFHAIAQVAEILRVRVFDVDPINAQSLIARLAPLNTGRCPIEVSPLGQLLEASDVICTATSVEVGEGPVINDGPTKPDVHINAVGSDLPGKTELPVSLLRTSFVCPDFPLQARIEGECQQLTEDQIGPSLLQLVSAPGQFADAKQSRTVFDSTGFALEDFVVMQLATDYAIELGLGNHLEIECQSGDPFNPYGDLMIAAEANANS